MSADEWIAKRREHLTAAAAANRRHVSLPFDQREVDRMAVALEALEAVLMVHQRRENRHGDFCTADGELWPCHTAHAIETALRCGS